MLLGHLGKDPQALQINNGKEIVSFSLATSESWKDKQTGEWKKQTEWHNIVVLNEVLVGVALKHLHKGSKVLIEGKIQTSKYKDKTGAERSQTKIIIDAFKGNIILLDPFESSKDHSHFSDMKQTVKEEIDLDDEITF